MASERPSDQGGEGPRTDLPPRREPYTDDYFGTGEEEGVVRERDAGDGEKKEDEEKDEASRGRGAAEDAAGGDRGIV
ncbi:MAG TPA: hypothetical protein VFL83_10040 [Anaeromyxobacter sp.]|nr:hypothetical protein [Anaeromyxobacter sp.]